jgi:hypothetical protein
LITSANFSFLSNKICSAQTIHKATLSRYFLWQKFILDKTFEISAKAITNLEKYIKPQILGILYEFSKAV